MALRHRVRELIAGRAWLVLLGTLAVWGLALSYLLDPQTLRPRLTIDPALESLMPRGGEALERFEQTRRRFGGDDLLLVAWFGEDLFTPDTLAAWKRLSRRVERMSGVADLDGMARAPIVRVRDDYTEVDQFLRELPQTRPQARALLTEALANPLYVGQLVAADGRGLLMGVHLDPGLDAAGQFALVDAITAASAEEAGDIEQAVTGPLRIRLEISRALFRDLYRVMPLAVLCTFLVATLGFRNLRGPLVPLVSNMFALSLTLTVFVHLGQSLNFVTIILPPVVYVVGFAYAVHVVSAFERHIGRLPSQSAAVNEALQEVFLPLTLTAFTTAIGFASLALSGIVSIRVFGLFAALGTLLAWLSALTLVPAALAVLPVRRAATDTGGLRASLAPALARFDLRHRRAIFVTAGIFTLASVLLASRIEVSTDYLQNFPAEDPLRTGFERVGATFAGSVPLQILIESDITDAFKQPAQLRVVADLQAWLLEQPEIGGAYSLVDYIGILHTGLTPEAAEGRIIPRSAALTDQLIMLGGDATLDRFADSRFTSTLLHVRSEAISTRALVALAARIEARLTALPEHLRGYVTGSSYLVARTVDDITRGQVASLGAALLVIYALLVLLFGGLRTAGLALLPNALPIVAFFGLLGLGGIPLNLTTSLVAAIALGIAVDDTIHFLTRFNAEARKIADESAAVAGTLAAVIRPVTFTTAALCAGFLALVTGTLENQVQFGLLAAATLAIAWVVDLTFTPALAGRLRFVTLWETLSVDLGAAPHLSIPLFEGLTERQARVAALMGVIGEHPRGTRLLAVGEHGNDICVLIDGELRASVTHDGEEIELRRMRRGALIGEVALFHGVRTANVDAETDVRVLTFSDRCLERLQRRYPRIGAQLYRNLGRVLAERLADATERL